MKRFLISAAAFAVLSMPALRAQVFQTVKVHFSEPVQVAGKATSAHRVPDWGDSVCDQPGGLAQRHFTLVTPGKASPSRPPAGSAEHTPMLGTATDKPGPHAAHSRWWTVRRYLALPTIHGPVEPR